MACPLLYPLLGTHGNVIRAIWTKSSLSKQLEIVRTFCTSFLDRSLQTKTPILDLRHLTSNPHVSAHYICTKNDNHHHRSLPTKSGLPHLLHFLPLDFRQNILSFKIMLPMGYIHVGEKFHNSAPPTGTTYHAYRNICFPNKLFMEFSH